MDIQEAIRSRRTIHSFSTGKVSEEIIDRAIVSANFAPCHRLSFPWRFTSLNVEKRKLLAELSLDMKFGRREIDQVTKAKVFAKILNPSHLLVASQILTDDLTSKILKI